MGTDRAHEGPTDKEWMDAANKQIADRGGKSRYVGTTTEEDWTLEQDKHAADEQASPLDDIDKRSQARAETAEAQTRQELIRRGLAEKYGLKTDAPPVGSVEQASPRAQTRVEALDRMIRYHNQTMGFILQRNLDEWEHLNGQPHPLVAK